MNTPLLELKHLYVLLLLYTIPQDLFLFFPPKSVVLYPALCNLVLLLVVPIALSISLSRVFFLSELGFNIYIYYLSYSLVIQMMY